MLLSYLWEIAGIKVKHIVLGILIFSKKAPSNLVPPVRVSLLSAAIPQQSFYLVLSTLPLS
jgi:hypothetical protein